MYINRQLNVGRSVGRPVDEAELIGTVQEENGIQKKNKKTCQGKTTVNGLTDLLPRKPVA